MVDYSEILRLRSLGHNITRTAEAIHSSRHTIREVWRLADEKDIIWPLTEELSNQQLYRLFYVRLPDLLNEFAVAKALNTQHKFKVSYAKYDLLIIDEWLLRPLPETEAYDLLEIIEACSKKGALILCTQYDTDEWYYRIDCDRAEDEDSAVAEGILDRIIHNKYSIEVKGRISMRKRHAFAESEEVVNS